jgi:cbb3-type cytochrome oxidase cytochrome c subunit
MEVINKLLDTEEALVNHFDHDVNQDADTSGAAGDPSFGSQATFGSQRTGTDLRRSTSRSSTRW